MDLNQIKIGGSDSFGRKILSVYCYAPSVFIVYGTKEGVFALTEKPVEERYLQISDIHTEVHSLQTCGLEKNNGLNKDVARAIVAALRGDIDKSIRIFDEVKERIGKIRSQIGKVQYIRSCIVFLLINFILSSILFYFNPNLVTTSFSFFFYIATCGSVGGFLSTSLNIRKLEIDIDAPKHVNILWGFSRIIISMIGALFTYFLMKADLFLGVIGQSNSSWAILSISVFAGFCESFVPNIYKKTEDKHKK